MAQVKPSRSKERSSVEPVFKRAREHADRIVAAVAVPRKFNPLGADEDVHAGSVERCPESVGVKCLTPLVIGLLVTMAAVSSIGKGGRLEKIATLGGGVSGQRQLVFCEREVIGGSNLVGVRLAYARLFRPLVLRAPDGLQAEDRSYRECQY